ncbi:maleate cis-trans isomerase [Pyrococcus furiosus DSM 3638]|uniref:Maleate cis-trans isomerase n=3 Tax=Pyrococcus furiosus TaxID=2261 RepID=A0A5C0XQG4_PYRFU|nr:aspartate/glutamate racemase family protein [Pyrococcus furiosus]AAL81468.1 putative maleate cis-trans isomerase [Pyrococcus furiosus DSM 3638]AFN04124.1 maleate cis-trans isomerase [Pyrococcus furiosus COM1]QEK78979.1 maleate cis-trans isomerase [Pyrococcus furiosus DSM 3638]
MFGWRGRIGLLVPSSNTTMEMELHSYLPEGVSLHTSRIPLKKVNEEELTKMVGYSIEGAKLLADAGVEVIAFGCTSGSFIGGKDFEKELEMKIEEEVKIETFTTSTAVLEALNVLDIQSLVVVTPYIDEINQREKEFLEENGFTVLDIRGLGIEDNLEIGRLSPYIPYMLAKSMFMEEADGVFISCTNLRTFEIIEKLERDLGIPVVTSNQATLWYALREIDVRESLPLGKLLREF